MFRSLALVVALSLVSGVVQAAEIATVMGRPGEHLDFTDGLIQERIELGPASKGELSSTWVYSILARKGIRSAVSVEVLADDGSGTTCDLTKGFQIAAKKAPVVFSTIDPIDDETCSELSIESETAFVIVAGNDAMYLDPGAHPHCLARNILRVAGLDQKSEDLTTFANWGDPGVRIAASSLNILSRGL